MRTAIANIGAAIRFHAPTMDKDELDAMADEYLDTLQWSRNAGQYPAIERLCRVALRSLAIHEAALDLMEDELHRPGKWKKKAA